jgi:type IV pilus assembly protein PilP
MTKRILKTFAVACLAAGALVAPGCGEGEKAAAPAGAAPAAAPAPAGAASKTATAAAPAAVTATAAPAAVSAPVEYTFDVSMRDPFLPVNPQARTELGAPIECGPLCTFDVSQLKITGIVWGISQPAAMLRAPDGKPYIVKVGTPIGRNKGKVVSITKDRIAVLEKYVNYRGEVVTNRVDIELPVEGGIR